MMKILTVIFNLEKGGTQRAAQVFAEGYFKLGYDSRVLSLYGLGSRYEEIKDSIHVWNRFDEKVLQEVIEWGPDIVHIHSHGPKHEDIKLIVNSLKDKKSKFIETNVFSKPSPWSNDIDISFQLSKWCLWLYHTRGGKMKKASIVPNPVKDNAFYKKSKEFVKKFRENYKIPLNAFVIGRIGQSFDGKWSRSIMDVFNSLAKENKNVYLVVVNPPQSILNLIDDSLYKDRIIYIPKIIGDTALSTAYSSFDVFYLAAEQGESFGMVIAEAILCETPVVTLATPWGDNSQGEVVQNNVGGYVVNSTDSAISIILKMLNKKLSVDTKKARNSIISRYGYLSVCKEALEYAMGMKKNELVVRQLYEIILSSLEDSYGDVSALTKFFIKMNWRQLTLYSTSYFKLSNIPMKIWKKMIRYKLSNEG